MAINNFKNIGKRKLELFLISIFLLLSSISFAIPSSLTLQGKLTNLAGSSQTGTFNFTFKIYDNATGGNELWAVINQSVTTDANGVYDVVVSGISNLSFADQYYLGISVQGENESVPRINLTSSPYSFRANTSDALNPINTYAVTNLNVSNTFTIGGNATASVRIETVDVNLTNGLLSLSNNITLGSKLTFAFGEIIENLVDGWITMIGNVNVTGSLKVRNVNVTGNLAINGSTNLSSDFSISNTFNVTASSGNLNIAGAITAGGVIISQGQQLQQDVNAFKRANVTDFLGVGNESVLKTSNISNIIKDTWQRANTTDYLGGADVNASLLKVGNISIIFKDNNQSLWNTTFGNTTYLYPKEGNAFVLIGSVNFSQVNLSDILTVMGSVATFGSLNATYINATQIRVGNNIVQVEANAWKVLNLTNFLGVDNASIVKTNNLSDFTRGIDAWLKGNATNFLGGTDVNASLLKVGNLTTIFSDRNASMGLWNITGNNIYPRFISGNVGIGTATPNVKLTVIGDVNISGSLNVSGNANISGSLYVVGNTFIGDSSSDTVEVNAQIGSDLVPNNNARNLGSPSNFWRLAYVDKLTVNNLSAASSNISGTMFPSFSINSNYSGNDDLDVSVVFERGSPVTNAVLKWDSTNKRFDINFPLFIEANQNLTVDTNTLFVDGSVKRVGIGTTSTAQTLTLEGTLNVTPSGGTPALFVISSGNVGIGTISPSDTLHVSGSARIAVNDTNNVSTTNILRLDHFTQNASNSTGGIGVGILLRAIDNGSNVDNIALINATLTSAINGSEDSAIGFYTRTGGGALAPRLFINGSNVGIGTTAPLDTLTVIGSLATFGSLNATYINATQIRVGNNIVQVEADAWKVLNLTNFLGVGNESVLKTSNISNIIKDTWQRANATDYLGGADVNASLVKSTNTTFLALFTRIADAFTRANVTDFFGDTNFNSSVLRVGNISNIRESLWNRGNTSDYLGEAGVNASLLKAGNLTTIFSDRNASMSLWNITGSNIYPRFITGNVGIGTATPGQTLHVVGNANISQTLNAPVINTTRADQNITISSGGGSVIIRLG